MNDVSEYPKPDRSRIGRLRDEIAFHVARFAFEKIATRWYAAMIEGSIRLGLDAARQESKAAAPTVSTEWIMRNAERRRREADRGSE